MAQVLETEHPRVTTSTLKVPLLESKSVSAPVDMSDPRVINANDAVDRLKRREAFHRLGMEEYKKEVRLRRIDEVWPEEELRLLKRKRTLKQPPKQVPASTTAALQPEAAWVPSEAALQRGRAILEAALHQSHNLPLSEFARRAHKSSQQIEKDIEARRLLAFDVKPFARKIPDWQLNPIKQQLTQRVLQRAKHIDVWTLYCALSYPLEVLGGRSPVDAVTEKSLDDSVETVLNVLSIH